MRSTVSSVSLTTRRTPVGGRGTQQWVGGVHSSGWVGYTAVGGRGTQQWVGGVHNSGWAGYTAVGGQGTQQWVGRVHGSGCVGLGIGFSSG